MRRLTAIAKADYILNNPRIPRRTIKGAQQGIRALKSTEEGAEETWDSGEKSALLSELYGKLFKATDMQANLPKWVDLERKFRREDLNELPRIDGPLLRKAINLFKNNKSCAEDKVVAEMLSALDEDLLETIAEAFTRRIINNEDSLIWRAPKESYHVIRYPFDPGPNTMDDFKRRRQDTSGARSSTDLPQHDDQSEDRAVRRGKGAPGPTCGTGAPEYNRTAGSRTTSAHPGDHGRGILSFLDDSDDETEVAGQVKKKTKTLWATHEVSLLAKIKNEKKKRSAKPQHNHGTPNSGTLQHSGNQSQIPEKARSANIKAKKTIAKNTQKVRKANLKARKPKPTKKGIAKKNKTKSQTRSCWEI